MELRVLINWVYWRDQLATQQSQCMVRACAGRKG